MLRFIDLEEPLPLATQEEEKEEEKEESDPAVIARV